MLATRDVLSQPSDGYTLLLCTHFESINTVLYRNPQYALRDIAPISLVAKYYYGLALSNAIPAATFEQFVAVCQGASGRSRLHLNRQRIRARRSWHISSSASRACP